jgi:hypothetical protein
MDPMSERPAIFREILHSRSVVVDVLGTFHPSNRHSITLYLQNNRKSTVLHASTCYLATNGKLKGPLASQQMWDETVGALARHKKIRKKNLTTTTTQGSDCL